MTPELEQQVKEKLAADPALKERKSGAETFSIQGVEVFAAGTWNGDTYTNADLDEMVRAQAEIGALLKPYLKLGHSKTQTLLSSGDLPAAGWMTGLRRQGSKLVADWTDIPKKVYELLRLRAYKRVSSEVLWNVTANGKKYPYALKAVALLGGETPAVQTLEDVLALYAACGPATAYSAGSEARCYDLNPQETNAMNEKELKDKIAALESENKDLREGKAKEFAAENTALKTANADLKKENGELKVRADGAETKLTEYALAAKKAKVTAKIDKLIADRKILPAQKEAAFAMLMAAAGTDEKAYSLGGKDATLDEAVEKFFTSAGAAEVNTDEGSEAGKPIDGEDLAEKATKYAAKHGVSVKEATIAVAREQERTAKA
jgi:hypothetical protein